MKQCSFAAVGQWVWNTTWMCLTGLISDWGVQTMSCGPVDVMLTRYRSHFPSLFHLGHWMCSDALTEDSHKLVICRETSVISYTRDCQGCLTIFIQSGWIHPLWMCSWSSFRSPPQSSWHFHPSPRRQTTPGWAWLLCFKQANVKTSHA